MEGPPDHAENEGRGERAPTQKQTRQGEAALSEFLAQRACIGDEREGQKVDEPAPRGKACEEAGSEKLSGDQIQCGETDEYRDVPRQSGPARNEAGEQAADTGPAVGACHHDDASDRRAEGGRIVEGV